MIPLHYKPIRCFGSQPLLSRVSLRPLPVYCQTSTINDLLFEDYDLDGNLDVLAIQNDYSFEPLGGRYDAGIGLLLKGDGRGNFKNMPVTKSGFFVDGDARSISKVKLLNKKEIYVVTQNKDSSKVFERN